MNRRMAEKVFKADFTNSLFLIQICYSASVADDS